MNNKSNVLYALLLLAALTAVMFMVYVFIGTYHNVPLASLVPVISKTKLVGLPTIVPSSPTGTIMAPIQKFDQPKGLLYVVTGKFVTAPTYNAKNVLQGYFMMNQDPTFHKILVILGKKTDKITVGTSQGSFNGRTTITSEDVDALQKSIKVNATVQLRFSIGSEKSANNDALQLVLDGIMKGDWSIPNTFILNPSIVGIIQ
jgi:hypothetical protein